MNLNPLLSLGFFLIAGLSAAQGTPTTSQELSLETNSGILKGTLLVPAQPAANAPVALIVAGSGPTDRDGNSPAGVNANTYKLLAEGLAAQGIASLRYDKLFSGSSQPKITREQDLSFETYVNDAAAWLNLLKKDSRFKSVFVIGHSEGSLVGMLAAEQTPVTGFISLAGPGRNIADVLLEQLKPQLTAPMYTETERVIGELRAGRTVVASSITLPAQVRGSLFRDSLQPYLISWMKFDPAVEIAKLKTNILVVQGSTDLQVKVLDAQLLSKAAGVRPVILDGVNHVLKAAPSEPQANLATYSNPNLPLEGHVVSTLTAFIRPAK